MELQDTAIAIVGMAGRFSGASDPEQLWSDLLAAHIALRRLDAQELQAAGVPAELSSRPSYVAAGAPLEGVADFDANFFGVPAHEARLMDPQQRLFLEQVWRGLEDAGHPPSPDGPRIGVFGSTSASGYLLGPLRAAGELDGDGINYPVLLGNDKDFLCTRVSYALGLRGPSMTVQSACSGSLTAVHVAVQSLLADECDLAVAGGVSVSVPHTAGYLYREGGILSPDGVCRVFDERARGTVKGNGCGVVVLRRLDDAVADQDRIVAVIAGTAVNNDGRDKAGFTAPGAAGQVAVIREALAVSGVAAADVGYVEAHGTGTSLGDPVELRALARAHSADGPPPERCYVGSLKANLGHLDAAAGVTGLIKTALVLREQTVPPQPCFDRANPALGLSETGYVVPTQQVRPDGGLRAAAVSSFGLGGTNAHAVLVPAPDDVRPAAGGEDLLLLLSARDAATLTTSVQRLREHLSAAPSERLDDVALTLAAGRAAAPARAVVRAADVPQAVRALDRWLACGQDGDLGEVARRWLAGERVSPAEVGDLSHSRRVRLPGHPLRPVRHWVDVEPQAPAARPALEGDLLVQVCAIVGGHLGAPALGPDDDVLDLGMDSMTAVEVVTALREELDVALGFEDVDGLRTAREIATLLGDRTGEGGPAPVESEVAQPAPVHVPAPRQPAAASAMVPIRRGQHSGQDLFLVHPAGGTTICYADLARHLPAGRGISAFAFPLREIDAVGGVRDLAGRYLAELRRVQPTGPYLLGGYSFGGNVAVEMALQLEAAGESVERVLLLDTHPPEAYVGGEVDPEAFLAAFPRLLASILPGARVPDDVPGGGVRGLLEAVRPPGWSSGMLDELERFFAVWQHNHEALKRWYPDRRLQADVVLLAASERESREILDTLAIRSVSGQAWRSHVAGDLRIVPVPGDHYSMMRDGRHLRAVAAACDLALSHV